MKINVKTQLQLRPQTLDLVTEFQTVLYLRLTVYSEANHGNKFSVLNVLIYKSREIISPTS